RGAKCADSAPGAARGAPGVVAPGGRPRVGARRRGGGGGPFSSTGGGGGDASRLPRVPDRCRRRGSPGPRAGAEEDDVRSPAAPGSRRPAGEDVPGGAHGAGRGPGARAGGRPAAGPQGDDDPSRGANSSTVSVLFADQAVTTFTESPV